MYNFQIFFCFIEAKTISYDSHKSRHFPSNSFLMVSHILLNLIQGIPLFPPTNYAFYLLLFQFILPILGQLFLSLTSTPYLLLSTALELFINTVVPPYPSGVCIFQYPQCMPETADGTKPYIYYVFFSCTVLTGR